MLKSLATMWTEFLAILSTVSVLLVIIAIGKCFLDLVWMCFMHWAIALSAVISFSMLYSVLHHLTGKPFLSGLIALATTALALRLIIDPIVWLYDISPVIFQRSWPFVDLEDRADYQQRRLSLPEWTWDYYRKRVRIQQELDFDEEVADDEIVEEELA